MKQQRFWVPVGGGVEFGETSREAIVREVREELDAGITDLRQLGVLESLFTSDGGQGHEIVFVYDARFADPEIYDDEDLTITEGDQEFTTRWIDPFAPDHGRALYREGLSDLLRRA